MNSRIRSAAIIAGVVILDRITKIYCRRHFTSWDPKPVVGGFFHIVHAENPGAAFGFLSESTGQWRGIFLVGVSLASRFRQKSECGAGILGVNDVEESS